MNTNVTVFPVPLSGSREAMLHLPNDLTTQEAEKVCAVVRALATQSPIQIIGRQAEEMIESIQIGKYTRD